MKGLRLLLLELGLDSAGHVALDLLDHRIHSVVGTVEGVGRIVMVDQRVLLDGDLTVVACHHLRHFVLLDFFLPR